MEKKKVSAKRFFKSPEWWEEHWQDMPEFSQKDLSPVRTILIHFSNENDIDDFAKLIDHRITKKTKYIWFPKADIKTMMDKRYVDEEDI